MTENNSELLAEIRNVTYTHWNHSEPTLKDLSLQIHRGTLNVLVGPSGSGKSTLCDLFNGKIPHLLGGDLKGEVWVAGMNTQKVEVKDLARKVGHVFQDPESMFATLYVEDEIAFGPENLRFEVAEIKEMVEELLGVIQMMPQRRNLVWNLSGGQVQKLGLATVLAMNPELIVLDEPTSNLDPAATRSVHELVLSLRDKGMTVLLVTRELDEFLAAADQLLVMEDGHLAAAGTPCQVLAEHGEYMVKSLGVWLPETAEIGIDLLKAGCITEREIPITVSETAAVLAARGLLPEKLHGVTAPQERPVAPGEELISAHNLKFSYGSDVYALKGVSLSVHAGEMLAIVGRNGAGKSTLAKLLVGLLKPQDGDLTLFGKPAKQWKVPELANHIALVFQNPEHQFLTDTVADEIGYSLLARGITDPDQVKENTDRFLDMLGLSGVAQAHPFSLSAGMKRRLGVATMLVGQPDVLVVDEPTYGQDKQMTETLMALMEDIRSRGIAVVMITHDMRLVQEYARRVVVMCEGQVMYDGEPAMLFENDKILASANLCPTVLQELLREIQGRGIPVEGLIRHPSDFLAALNVPGIREENNGC